MKYRSDAPPPTVEQERIRELHERARIDAARQYMADANGLPLVAIRVQHPASGGWHVEIDAYYEPADERERRIMESLAVMAQESRDKRVREKWARIDASEGDR